MNAAVSSPPDSPALLAHGLHPRVPDAVYHGRVLGIASKSALDLVQRSPAHYKAWVDGHEEEPTAAMAFGSALHAAILEPDVFARRYAAAPDFGDCRLKENKTRRDEWRMANAGKRHLSATDYARIQCMMGAVHGHPLAGKMIRDGEPEITARWRDEETGLECKARGDYFVRKLRMLVDVKSAEDASPEGFRKAVANYGYHRQDAFYRQGFTASGAEVEHFVFVVVEKQEPFAVATYAIDAAGLSAGAASVARDMRTLAECMSANKWPGYEVGIRTLTLPPWAA